MRFVVFSETDKETPERHDSAALALEAVSAFSAERRRGVRFFSEDGAPVSLAELQSLAAIENESDED